MDDQMAINEALQPVRDAAKPLDADDLPLEAARRLLRELREALDLADDDLMELTLRDVPRFAPPH